MALAAVAAFLDRPLLRYAFAYLAGAVLAESAATAVVLVGLGESGFTRQRPTRSGWFYIAVGLLMLAFAVVAFLRSRRRPKESKRDNRVHEGRLAVAFGLGIVMWLPSPTYLAALKQIDDTHSGWALTTVYGAIAVILVLWMVEIPIILFLLWREPVRHHLGRANGWIKRHGPVLLAGLTAVAGVGIVANGIIDLV